MSSVETATRDDEAWEVVGGNFEEFTVVDGEEADVDFPSSENNDGEGGSPNSIPRGGRTSGSGDGPDL